MGKVGPGIAIGWVQNLSIIALIKRVSNPPLDSLLELVQLKDRRNSPYKTYSLGMKQRLGLAQALLHKPTLIVLDEPTNDLDIETICSLENSLLEFAGCVLCVSHDRHFLDKICTHILAYEGNSEIKFFVGNYQEYEVYKRELYKKENKGEMMPKPITYAPLVGM